MADDILRQAVQGISEIILKPGLINLDFSDIKAAISGMGHALIGNAVARGDNAAVEAGRAEPVAHRFDYGAHLVDDDWRQSKGRLVEQKNPRLGHQAASNRKHLLLAATQVRAFRLALLRQDREE